MDALHHAPTNRPDVALCYQRYHAMVYRRCMSILHNAENAEDLTQEVFLKLVAKRDSLDDRALSSLLYQIATRLCLNKLRNDRRRPPLTDITNQPSSITPLPSPCAPLAAHNPESRIHARASIQKIFSDELPSTQTIATLHLRDGYTLDETAARVGLSTSGVRRRLRILRSHAQHLSTP